jgi:PadR family transcriptional regulator PadR
MGWESEPRLSLQGMQVLQLFVSREFEELTGSQLIEATGLTSGTIYPLLGRFEHAGWLKSRWEMEDPGQARRPRRRCYCITALGVRQASSLRKLVFKLAPA